MFTRTVRVTSMYGAGFGWAAPTPTPRLSAVASDPASVLRVQLYLGQEGYRAQGGRPSSGAQPWLRQSFLFP
ncbi:hypothetical protein NDU88_005818 [Pleurodeles waltl]|uniref:Uncharacterized protein n=1 Tax=Pleurodeles waltl TaxID=8319 RepID=A0AAV7MB41_PLEWA|nr:hypothetical protein NDU88_005818 [Pleurodeles waltl]